MCVHRHSDSVVRQISSGSYSTRISRESWSTISTIESSDPRARWRFCSDRSVRCKYALSDFLGALLRRLLRTQARSFARSPWVARLLLFAENPYLHVPSPVSVVPCQWSPTMIVEDMNSERIVGRCFILGDASRRRTDRLIMRIVVVAVTEGWIDGDRYF